MLKELRVNFSLLHNLKKLDENDPVKYDYALFGLSIGEDITSL